MLLIIWLTCFSLYSTKNMEQQYLVIIFHTKCERWNSGQLRSQAGFCEQDWFIVRNWSVLLWQILLWYGTHVVFEW